MTQKQIDEVLELHKLWLQDKKGGKRADLLWANLRWATLRGADLHGANLRGADLHGANLREADLHGANLRGADLSDADLREADLRDADLRWATLRGADLHGANLRWADLSGADLHGANLRWADLSGANLDFSCLPLWCGSLFAKFDKKHYTQFLYHTLKSLQQNDLIDEDFKKRFLTVENISIANEFHRVDKCGLITEVAQ